MALVSAPALRADILGEGIDALRCNDQESLRIPRKMNLLQTIMSDDMEGFDFIAVGVLSEYDGGRNINQGKIIATAHQIRSNGSETMLAKVTARMRNGTAENLRIFPGSIEQGDQIRWNLKLKKLPALTGELGCWDLRLVIAVANQIPDLR
jgi:hypothetical protein